MRILGLDIGSKHIGMALSDGARIAAHPLNTLIRSTLSTDIESIATVVIDNKVCIVVVGMPYDLSGKIGKNARHIQSFINTMASSLSVPIDTWDERFSTKAAEKILLEAGLSRKQRKSMSDQQSAIYILQGWLDAHREREDSE